MEVLNEICGQGIGTMLSIMVIACIIVMLGMAVDLCSGLYKAKQRGETRSSYALKRTLRKFISYEGGMFIAGGIDLLIRFSHIYQLFGLELLHNVPLVSCLVGIFLLIVEYISVREKADEKTRSEIANVRKLAAKIVTKDELARVLTEILDSRK